MPGSLLSLRGTEGLKVLVDHLMTSVVCLYITLKQEDILFSQQATRPVVWILFLFCHFAVHLYRILPIWIIHYKMLEQGKRIIIRFSDRFVCIISTGTDSDCIIFEHISKFELLLTCRPNRCHTNRFFTCIYYFSSSPL
jgi:hypothetical protein